jgi:hypothetical protein
VPSMPGPAGGVLEGIRPKRHACNDHHSVIYQVGPVGLEPTTRILTGVARTRPVENARVRGDLRRPWADGSDADYPMRMASRTWLSVGAWMIGVGATLLFGTAQIEPEWSGWTASGVALCLAGMGLCGFGAVLWAVSARRTPPSADDSGVVSALARLESDVRTMLARGDVTVAEVSERLREIRRDHAQFLTTLIPPFGGDPIDLENDFVTYEIVNDNFEAFEAQITRWLKRVGEDVPLEDFRRPPWER